MHPTARVIITYLLLVIAAITGRVLTARAASLSGNVETGAVWFSRNDVGVPGGGSDAGDRFDLLDLTGRGPSPYARIYLIYEFNERDLVRLLVAPLQVEGGGRLSQPTRFRDEIFEANEASGTYKFNTYRLTYRRTFRRSDEWRLGLGGALLIRDAAITLEQVDLMTTESNVGIVPLLHLYCLRRFGQRTSASLDIEGLGAPQGRAIDAAVTVNYRLGGSWTGSLGYRTLEGGADNDKVYTFAWLHYLLVSVSYHPGCEP
ncbi:MAG: hypothetical protein WAW06_02990 [bacterium]